MKQYNTHLFLQNLDDGITEQYLYAKFKQVGEISSLNIAKDKMTKLSKGRAYITFKDRNCAQTAVDQFDKTVFIKNTIRVKLYQPQERKPILLITNLDRNCEESLLEHDLSKFGNILSLELEHDGSYGWVTSGKVEFQRIEDAEGLMNCVSVQPFILEGKKLKFSWYKDAS